MSQQRNVQQAYTEGDIILAISDITSNQVSSVKRAAAIYNVPRTTVRRRRAGQRSRRDCEPNSKRLTKLEEEAIVQRVLEESSRGIPPSKAHVQDMADRLLRERGGKPTGKNWVDNFIKRTPELQMRWSRPYDRQRAACEDPVIIRPWFSLVQSVKAKYGILDEDTWNFDESGFMMGKISSQLVVTGSEKPGKQKKLQPGDREWVTLVQGVAATGRVIPPFLIFAGKVLISTWYTDLPRNWVIDVSPTGWINNDLALAWLKHFDAHTKASSAGAYRLLIIDGHDSRCSIEFQDYCKENNIIALCMPPHSSHLLQPLDVVPYSLLKRHYGDGISLLARSRIHHIDKETFLPAFKAAFEKTFTVENIRAGFRGAGLVPYDPDVVLSKLDVQLRTPTPPAPGTIAWEAQTPRNARETEAQSMLIRNRMQNHQGSPASSLDEQVKQLSKGAQQIAHNMVLVQEEMGRLRDAVDTLTKRKTRKRRYVRVEETLTVGKVSNLIAAKEGGSREDGETPAKRVRAERRCGRCSEIGHNSRTCKVEIEDEDSSDASK
ncbi:hypothetical protein PtrM4_151280 [Pyrenophora tritici-repentis]|uniref:HTH CENPB-type domain-containing protein n=2 Tax=Pyrenophora tritici-repentis TaxID=45151 RepID=A0A834RMI0_9PLEO|nr:hypothetical protein PtrM4_151280 [Pyrenophora tritici-repentis]